MTQYPVDMSIFEVIFRCFQAQLTVILGRKISNSKLVKVVDLLNPGSDGQVVLSFMNR